MTAMQPQRLALCLIFMGLLAACAAPAVPEAAATTASSPSADTDWTDDFDVRSRRLEPTGQSKYFVLLPGARFVFVSGEGELTISVLAETRLIGGISTRVVEEREEENGALAEVSRNYYAIDNATGDVFYFGEDVDMYSNGQAAGHTGSWLAYEGRNRPGLIMPGKPVAGMKYMQELAPGVAEDRARVVSVVESVETGMGHFDNCLVTEETTALEPGVRETKAYCPGVGLVKDEALFLSGYTIAGSSQP